MASTGELVGEYNSGAEAERKLGLSPGCISDALTKNPNRVTSGYKFSYSKDSKVNRDIVVQNNTKGISLSDFEKKFDPIEIIRREVNKLDRKYMIPNADFIRNCKFPPGIIYKDYLELTEFEKYCGRVGTQVFWSHPDTIEHYKNLGKLL